MKKDNNGIFALVFVLLISITVSAFLGLILVGLSVGMDIGRDDFFEQETSYQTFEAKVVAVEATDGSVTLELVHQNEDFGAHFCLVGQGAEEAMANNVVEALPKDTTVTIVAAATSFDSKGRYPVAALKTADTTIVSFETGMRSLVDAQAAKSHKAVVMIVVIACVFVVFGAALAVTVVVGKKKHIIT